jgi:hypothetical protein
MCLINKIEYIQICQKYNIYIFSINEITNYKEFNVKEVIELYKKKYNDKIILWYK